MDTKIQLIEKAIIRHCYDGFPRGKGFPRQSLCHSSKDLLDAYWQYNGSAKGIYTSIFSERIKESRRFNKFYFDFDNELNPKAAYFDMLIMIRDIERLFGINPRVYFSGMKGFAVYLDIGEKYKFKDYSTVYKRLRDYFLTLNLTTLDGSVIGDINRISRIPFSIHKKSKKMCIPVDLRWSFETIIANSLAYEGSYYLRLETASNDTPGYDMLIHWDETAKEYNDAIRKDLKSNGYIGNIDLELVLKKAKCLENYREVLMYRVIIPQMLFQGKSSIEIQNYCYEFAKISGFKRNWKKVIDYQIKRYQARRFKPMSQGRLLLEYPELRKILYG